MLTLVLSCDEPGCATRHELAVHALNTPNGIAAAATDNDYAAGWRRVGILTLSGELRCPEHAGAI